MLARSGLSLQNLSAKAMDEMITMYYIVPGR